MTSRASIGPRLVLDDDRSGVRRVVQCRACDRAAAFRDCPSLWSRGWSSHWIAVVEPPYVDRRVWTCPDCSPARATERSA